MALKPFDQVFVRENPDFEAAKNIVLSGEVKYPGTYTLLSKDEKISSVIKRAGGLTNYAYMDGVTMYRKFEVFEEEIVKSNISKKLREEILSIPELAILYANEFKKLINVGSYSCACSGTVSTFPKSKKYQDTL